MCIRDSSLVLVDESDKPVTPVFTWLDHQGGAGLEFVRNRLGQDFHQLTGCRYHPTFPVFKLASLRLTESALLEKAKNIVSIKALLIRGLTGNWIEDHGIASASGLF